MANHYWNRSATASSNAADAGVGAQPHPQNAASTPTDRRDPDALVREVGQVGELYALHSAKTRRALRCSTATCGWRFRDSEWDIAITDLTNAEAALMLASRDGSRSWPSGTRQHWTGCCSGSRPRTGDHRAAQQLAEDAATKDVPLTVRCPGRRWRVRVPAHAGAGREIRLHADLLRQRIGLREPPNGPEGRTMRDYRASPWRPAGGRTGSSGRSFEEIARHGAYGCDSRRGPGDRVRAVRAIHVPLGRQAPDRSVRA